MLREVDVLVVGAGMSGLIFAKHWAESQPQSSLLVLDKGRGVGGRLANRRCLDSAYDTGAQFIRARSHEFKTFLRPHVESGVLCHWYDDDQGFPVFRGREKMTALPKALAQGLELSLGQKLVELRWSEQDQVFHCVCESGLEVLAKKILLTAPVPQVLELFQHSGLEGDGDEWAALSKVRYRKTLVLLARCSEWPSQNVQGMIPVSGDVPLDLVVDHGAKGIVSAEGSVSFVFNAEFSDRFYDHDLEDIHKEMLVTLESTPYQILRSEVKKWKFSDPLETFGALHFRSKSYPQLFLAGDGFGGGSVEGAFRSAMSVLKDISRG